MALESHAPLVRRPRGGLHGRRTQRRPGRAPPVRPHRAREHRRGTRVERRARPAARPRPRVRVRLGLGRPRRQPWRRADRGRPGRGGRARHGPQRAVALLLAGWIEASTGDLALAREHVDAATDLAESSDDPDLKARCAYYLAYVVSHHGEFREALALTDRSRAIYDGMDRPWDQAANALFAARAAISARRTSRAASRRSPRSSAGWRSSTTRGCTLAGRRSRASWRASSTGSGTPSPTSRQRWRPRTGSGSSKPRPTSCQPGPGAVPGRRLRRRSRHPADRDRQGGGHRGRPAGRAGQGAPGPGAAGRGRPPVPARRSSPRPRGTGRRRRRAGAAGRVPPGRPGRGRRRARAHRTVWSLSSTEAREQDAAHVEVFALDALGPRWRPNPAREADDRRARWTEADRRMAGRLALHHRCTTGPDAQSGTTQARQPVRGPSGRSLRTRKPNSPLIDHRDAHHLRVAAACSPSRMNDHTTARAGCATWAIPMVPIWMVLLRVDQHAVRADTGEQAENQHVGPAGAAQPEDIAVGERQREHRDHARSD